MCVGEGLPTPVLNMLSKAITQSLRGVWAPQTPFRAVTGNVLVLF